MNVPVSSFFTPVSLDGVYNTTRNALPDALKTPAAIAATYGATQFRGIPFELGAENADNVILLKDDAITVELGGVTATYFLFLHVVEDIPTNYQEGFADDLVDGNELGSVVSNYCILYEDGSHEPLPILRRLAIQQGRINWGASAFASVPATEPRIFSTASEEWELGRMPSNMYGRGEQRTSSARDSQPDNVYLYAMPNPHPDKIVQQIELQPIEERSAVYALTYTDLVDHPLRPGTRKKLRLTLPADAELNALGELDTIAIDLGHVISARAVLEYDESEWRADTPQVQPNVSAREVVVEYAAHPSAKLYVQTGDSSLISYTLSDLSTSDVAEVAAAERPVKIHIVEKGSGKPAAVRLHIHGAAGEYLPPRGHHRKVNGYWFEDYYAEFVNQRQQYSYVDGSCIADLPLGKVYFEMTRGYEVSPIRTSVEITPETEELTFELDKVLHWRERGWVTADTHVHFLSPQTALLEGKAEGVNVVNLLASQWGEMYSNVGDFDGRTTIGAKEFGGDGEFMVRVGTENRMQVLGHISLLGYSGEMIHPLCTGGPSESAVGDAQEVTMAEWAQRCIDQAGLVVLPHAPNPQLERAADIVLGVVNAIEMMSFNPFNAVNPQVSAYGLADWYRYLNLGYHVPVVGGSDKMTAASLLGGIRTYAHLGERELSYENWMHAVRKGNTFVTVGPLVQITVNGVVPGGKINLPSSGGHVDVEWRVESATTPVEAVEVVVGGFAVDEKKLGGQLSAEGSATMDITDTTWIALRVRGGLRGDVTEVAAHSSAVQVLVEGKELFSDPDAIAVLEQIEGAIAYVDTLAPRPEARRYKQLRATLETAYNRLHQRMHQQGLFHRHTPVSLHNHEHHHEH